MKVGSRVRYDDVRTATMFPHEWHPPVGALGTIIEMPSGGMIGVKCRVRWDSGQVRWVGSMEQITVLP
jgi:hypothetical protein